MYWKRPITVCKRWVDDRLYRRRRHWGSVLIVNLKLGQTSKRHVLTETTDIIKLGLILGGQIFALFTRYQPFRMILVIFVTKNGVFKNVPGIPDSLRGYYPRWVRMQRLSRDFRQETAGWIHSSPELLESGMISPERPRCQVSNGPNLSICFFSVPTIPFQASVSLFNRNPFVSSFSGDPNVHKEWSTELYVSI